jgi:hemerythrin superfamily protein
LYGILYCSPPLCPKYEAWGVLLVEGAAPKLIDTIGEQIRLRTEQGSDVETLKKRILLFATTVESHNASEESLIFPYWITSSGEDNVKSSAMKIIQVYGLNRYFQLTGISEKLIETLN